MHIALSTPVSLDLFAPYVDHTEVLPQGFSYPFAFYLTLELLEQGHRVTVVTSAYDVKQHSVWQGMEGRLTVIATPRRHPREYCLDVYRREVSSMCAELKKAAPDIIHAQWTYEFADAALSTGIPCVVTARDAPWLVAWHFKRFYRLYRAVYSSIWQIPRIRHLTCVSPHILEILQREPLLKAKTLVVIPNGLDRRFFAAGPRYEVHNSTSPRFVSVTGWSSLKNVPCLLRAFSIVKRVYPSATLILIGDGVGTGGAAEKWAKKRRLADGVEFTGILSHKQILALLEEVADVCVHTTKEESFSMVTLEAMAKGVPVVGGRRSGGVPWLLGNGCGVLVDISSPASVAAGMTELLDDPEFYSDTARAAYQKAYEHFTIDAVARQYLRVYARVLNRDDR